MKEKYQKILEKRLGKRTEHKKESTSRSDIQKLKAANRKLTKENKRLKSEVKSLERAIKKSIERIEELSGKKSLEDILREIYGEEKEEETDY